MNNYTFTFEKLDVWQLAKQLVLNIYKNTANFPDNEKFGLTNQINRSAVSVASNLAEGSARLSSKDQAHFSQLAYSSLMELICQLDISYELNYINEDDYLKFREHISILAGKITGLRKSQLHRST